MKMLNKLFLSFILGCIFQSVQGQGPMIYSCWKMQAESGEPLAFMPLSDGFPYSEDPDSSVIDQEYTGDTEKAGDEHELQPKFRKRFLERLGLSEKDSIYFFNFERDDILAYPIKGTPLMAYPNHYMSKGEAFEERDYFLGFIINDSALFKNTEEYYHNTLASVAPKNPFLKGNCTALIWEPLARDSFPRLEHRWDSIATMKTLKNNGEAYQFHFEQLHYYLLHNGSDARLIVKNDSGQIRMNVFYMERESASLYSLSFNGEKRLAHLQWTGKLLKDQPVMVYGFRTHSFGCASLRLMGGSSIPIYCDNRH